MSVKRSNADRSDETRGRLLEVARRLFAERGFAATPTEEVVREAGVTRGALYYHFRDKQDLFRAVVEELQQQIMERIEVAAAGAADPWSGLQAGLQAFLDACLDPAVQRVVLLDAPSALGWAEWRELDERYGFRLLRDALQALMEAGLLERQPVEPLAHLLLGALSAAGLLIAEAADTAAARAEVGATLDRLLRGLRPAAG
jgi:AcrR family transcriptional regulator